MESSMTRGDTRQALSLFPGSSSFYQFTEALLRKESSVVLLRVELDGLDFVLRTFGPEGCERLLREVGRRMEGALRSVCRPFQFSQDRFVLVLTSCGYEQAVEQAAELVRALRRPFALAQIDYRLEASVGIGHFPIHARDLDGLLRAAVFACHLARQRGSGYALYDHALDERERERFRLMAELGQALKARRGLELHFQPLVELASGHCLGVEALCRWRHPELGPLAPADFLPYVEQASLSLPLAEVVLDLALEQARRLREGGFAGLLSVNLSPGLCARPEAIERLLEQSRHHALPPGELCFEFPGRGIVAQPARAAAAMRKARERGVCVLVDDFGTGVSTLGTLAELPIDGVKLDPRLLELQDTRSRTVLSAIVGLAQSLGLKTGAKRIESEAQVAACRALGLDFGQGYHLARPMTRGDLLKWLRGRAAGNGAD